MLKREMEFAMFDALVEQCQARGIRKIVGVYIPSKKNSMVAGHYASLGFSRDGRDLRRPGVVALRRACNVLAENALHSQDRGGAHWRLQCAENESVPSGGLVQIVCSQSADCGSREPN